MTNNHDGNEHCAHMRTGPCTTWKDTWADLDCNTSFVKITCTDMGSRPVDYTKHALCEFGKQPCKFTTSRIDDKKETASTAGAKKKKFSFKSMFLAGVSVLTIAGSVALGVLLVIAVSIGLYIGKRWHAKKLAETVVEIDENPTYDDYYDPDPVMEVEDNNVYYSSDYNETEVSRTTDNNSLYGY